MAKKEHVIRVRFTAAGVLDEISRLPDSTPDWELGVFDWGDDGYGGDVRATSELAACEQVTREFWKLREEKPGEEIYCSSYCNFGHRVRDGKPVEHECRIIPPQALQAEMDGDYETAQMILQRTPVKMMRRGVKGNV